MALVLADRVRELTTTTGTGTITLGGTFTGFQSFAAIGNGNTTYYTIAGQGTAEWEVGIGTYTAVGTTLSRDTVLASSNGGSLVNFSAGTKDVFCDYPAGRAVYLDTATNATLPGLTVNANSSTNALRITQTGTGNALVVEDSTSPDSTPLVIDQNGTVVSVTTSAVTTQSGIGRFQAATISAFAGIAAGSTATNAATIDLSRSRGTAASPTVVSSGDSVGKASFGGHDGTAYLELAKIEGAVDGTPGTNDMPGRLVFSTTSDGASTPTERMRIDSAGRVGIGSSSLSGFGVRIEPAVTGATGINQVRVSGAAQSDVTGSLNYVATSAATAAAAFTLPNMRHFLAVQGTIGAGSTVTNQFGYFADSTLTGATNNYGFYSNIASGTGRWNFYANGTADNYFAGNVGIGVAPTTKLDVAGTSRYTFNVSNAYTLQTSLNAAGSSFADDYKNASQHIWQTSGTERMRIDSSGNVGVGTASPGYKLDVAGVANATTVRASNGLVVNSATVSANYTIASGDNAMSAGPVSVAAGVSVTVSSGSVWTVV